MPLRAGMAVYSVLNATVRGQSLGSVTRNRAWTAPLEVWDRAIQIEQCAPQFVRALRHAELEQELPEQLAGALQRAASDSLVAGLRLLQQLADLRTIARETGVRIIALKGAARLLRGEPPGARSIVDIDLLARPEEARRFHDTLRTTHGYVAHATAPSHHLPRLTHSRAIPVEIHPVSDAVTEMLWNDAVASAGDSESMLVPSATTLMVHTLEHAAVGHWARRYRLRDVLDVAALWSQEVDADRIASYTRGARARPALEVLLSAAHELNTLVPSTRYDAWGVVGRVGLARMAVAAAIREPNRARRAIIIASVLAEGSPRSFGRLITSTLWRQRGAGGQPKAAAP